MTEYIVSELDLNRLVVNYMESRMSLYSPISEPERIVRCRDCKFGIKDEYGDIECHSDQWQGYAGLCNEVNPDGFCAWGEPREE